MNHPLVRVSQSAPGTGSALRLDVGNQSAFLSGAEALDLHDRLTDILVLRGLLVPSARGGHIDDV
jgi:hypothetical protein